MGARPQFLQGTIQMYGLREISTPLEILRLVQAVGERQVLGRILGSRNGWDNPIRHSGEKKQAAVRSLAERTGRAVVRIPGC